MAEELRADLAAWPGLRLGERFAGGVRNAVFRAEYAGRAVVVRRSTRPAASLAWELDLLAYLAEHDVGVPRIVPSADGARERGGVLVTEFVVGEPPAGERDWRRVADAVRRVHSLTRNREQRPGSARALSIVDRGGDVRLDAMPPDVVRLLRTVWRGATGSACVVHGDLNAGNILLTASSVMMLDWDESRVDAAGFDLGDLPGAGTADRLATLAWEVATCWCTEPAYARERLTELRASLS